MFSENALQTKKKTAPVTPFSSLQRALNGVFEDFEHKFGLAPSPFRGEWQGLYSPELDVVEEDKRIVVKAEIPGVGEEDIEVTVQNGNLSLRGEKRSDQEEERNGYYRRERHFGSFSRTIPLPCEIEKDKVTAKFKAGVLTIDLPKTPESQSASRKIPVRAE